MSVTVDNTKSFQQMVGFGAAMTGSSAWLISRHPKKDEIMSELFAAVEDGGFGISMLRSVISFRKTDNQRVGILDCGSFLSAWKILRNLDAIVKTVDFRLPVSLLSDFMVDEYTYLSKPDDRDLESFSIEKDFDYFIPLLKEALSINPNLKFISAPWSAPADFKTSNSLYGGGMKDDWLEPYSRYLAKYIKAYKGQDHTGLRKATAPNLSMEP